MQSRYFSGWLLIQFIHRLRTFSWFSSVPYLRQAIDLKRQFPSGSISLTCKSIVAKSSLNLSYDSYFFISSLESSSSSTQSGIVLFLFMKVLDLFFSGEGVYIKPDLAKASTSSYSSFSSFSFLLNFLTILRSSSSKY